ncbi:hypothetical protein ACIQNU_27620 [Streptomyces sp. NPDC091292]|uniref:hypothetical protein n=1 Tax=Streptomyces sp. NPDC091292 TaxID=3365991 RepID=UPI0037F78568
MRRALIAASLAAVTCLALTACENGTDDDGGAKPSASPTTSQPAKQPSPTTTATDAPAVDDSGPAAVGWNEPQRTVGGKTIGILEITPTTVVYATKGGAATPQNGVFAVVVLSEKSMSANAADEESAAGGWQWIGPDGKPVTPGGGNAGQVTLDGYVASGPIEPGTTATRARIFDITPAQAQQGKLVYTDGTEAPFAWRPPAQDTGPQVADVKGKLGS